MDAEELSGGGHADSRLCVCLSRAICLSVSPFASRARDRSAVPPGRSSAQVTDGFSSAGPTYPPTHRWTFQSCPSPQGESLAVEGLEGKPGVWTKAWELQSVMRDTERDRFPKHRQDVRDNALLCHRQLTIN